MEARELLERALTCADEGDWQEMARILRDNVEDHAEDAAVHCWLGVAERELGLEGVAYERFKRALALDPEDPYVLATAGNGIAAFDDPEAEQALRTASLMAPDIPLTRFMYGAYLSREGFVDEGVKELEAARALDQDDPQIAYELGVARHVAGDDDGAVDALADAVRLDPEQGWARVVLGLVMVESGQIEEGVGELTAGAYLRPEDIEAQLVAALAAAATGAEAIAFEMLERARMRSDDEDSVLVLAVEDRLDEGPDAARRLLLEEMSPDVLRRRVQERP